MKIVYVFVEYEELPDSDMVKCRDDIRLQRKPHAPVAYRWGDYNLDQDFNSIEEAMTELKKANLSYSALKNIDLVMQFRNIF
jgi:hypothetical protein